VAAPDGETDAVLSADAGTVPLTLGVGVSLLEGLPLSEADGEDVPLADSELEGLVEGSALGEAAREGDVLPVGVSLPVAAPVPVPEGVGSLLPLPLGEGVAAADSEPLALMLGVLLAATLPLSEGGGVPVGEGVSLPERLALGVSLPDPLPLPEGEGGRLPDGDAAADALSLGDAAALPLGDGGALALGVAEPLSLPLRLLEPVACPLGDSEAEGGDEGVLEGPRDCETDELGVSEPVEVCTGQGGSGRERLGATTVAAEPAHARRRRRVLGLCVHATEFLLERCRQPTVDPVPLPLPDGATLALVEAAAEALLLGASVCKCRERACEGNGDRQQ